MQLSPLPPDIRQLPIPQRLQLAEQIWESVVEDEKSFQLTEAQKAELDRRLAARTAAPDRGSTWPNVKRRLLGE